ALPPPGCPTGTSWFLDGPDRPGRRGERRGQRTEAPHESLTLRRSKPAGRRRQRPAGPGPDPAPAADLRTARRGRGADGDGRGDADVEDVSVREWPRSDELPKPRRRGMAAWERGQRYCCRAEGWRPGDSR